jgi:DHA1 family tetracycline resistance protein-like MFS transporter
VEHTPTNSSSPSSPAPLQPGEPRETGHRGHRAPALSFIFFTLVLDILGIGLLIPVAPKLVAQLAGGSESHQTATYGYLVATYALMQFIFAPILGSLSDKYGRRPVILCSLAGTGLDYFAMALAPTLPWLFVTRAINGISGANITACNAYIADVTPPDKRAAGYGMVGAAFAIGFVLGPLLGGWLAQYDIRLPMWVAGSLALLNWLYGFFVLPESLKREHRRPFSWSRANPIGAIAGLGKYPVAIGLAITMTLVQLAQFGLHSTWTLYTIHRYGWSELMVGVSLAVAGLTGGFVQGVLARKIIPRIGEPRALIFGLCVATLAFAGYGASSQGWMILAVLVAASIGAIWGPAAQALITTAAPPDEQGAVQGAMTSLQSVAQVIAPLAATQIYAAFIDPENGLPDVPGAWFYVGAVLCAIGAGNAWRVVGKRDKAIQR